MTAKDINERISSIEDSVLAATGGRRRGLVMEYMRLKELLEDLAVGRVIPGVTDGIGV